MIVCVLVDQIVKKYVQQSALMVRPNTLAPSPEQETLPWHIYDEAIVKYHQPRIKFNFPEGMPIEDQSDDDDGFWA